MIFVTAKPIRAGQHHTGVQGVRPTPIITGRMLGEEEMRKRKGIMAGGGNRGRCCWNASFFLFYLYIVYLLFCKKSILFILHAH